MEANFVKQFIEKTGCDSETAYKFLEKCNWDLGASFEQWNKMVKHEAAVTEVKKLSRGISEASDNEVLVYRARDALANDFDNKRFNKLGSNYLNIPETNFFLPNFDKYESDFQGFLVKDLIDKNVMRALEDSGKLNWWCNTIGYKNRLWPLLTSGDGNCLLHAASLSMFGFHDRLLTLRQALYSFIASNNPVTESIKRRWRWHESKLNLDIGIQHTEEEWEREWSDVVNSASTNKLSGEANGCYQGLEAIHILCLAHVLRRVIIVIANTIAKDSHDEPLTPIYFDGIYIPFAFDERSCWKSPLLLIYNNSHFSALVFMEHESDESVQSQFCIPIVQYEGDYLPIRFLVDPGADFNWKNFLKAHVHLEESKRNSQLNVVSSYMEVFNFYNSPMYSKESENRNEHGEGDMTNNNIPKQLQNLSKQFLFLKKLATPKKEKVCDNTKMPLFCVKICIKKHAFQNEIIGNYIKFARQRFEYSQISQYSPHDTNKFSQDAEFVSCINKCGGYATENTSYLCPICFKQQKKQLQLLEDNTLCFAAGKSKFYREPDLANYSATKNLPKPILKSNNTLYLSNSTFFNDSNKPFSHHNNNLKDNDDDAFEEDVYPQLDCENISNVEDKPKNLVSEFCFGLVPASDSLDPGALHENWDRGVSKENSDISITHIG